MNRIFLLASLFLISHIPVVAMNYDNEEEDERILVPLKKELIQQGSSPVEIYNNDFYQAVAEHSSKYTFPMNQVFNDDEIQNNIRSINDDLWTHHLQLTFEKNTNKVIANLNLVELSHIHTGKETLLPFHRIEIPIVEIPEDKDSWLPILRKKLIQKRLHQLKDLALAYSSNPDKLHNALKNFRDSITFTDKIKTMGHQIRSEVEHDIILHLRDTLTLPLLHLIQKQFPHNPNVTLEKNIKALEKKIDAENPVLEKIDDLNIIKDQLAKVRFKKAEKEEEFINLMERTAEFLAAKERK
jgi:hypothetical protein